METFVKNLRFKTFFFLLLVLMSCKEDDPKPDPIDKEELIVENWNIGPITLGGQGLTSTTYSIKFNADGSFTFNPPGVPGLPQTGTWIYQASPEVIKLNNDTDLVVDEITPTDFRFTYTYKNHKMGTVEVKFTLKK